MDYFTKKRVLFWGAALLIIMNISALATIWFQQHQPPNRLERPEPPEQRVGQFLKEELALSGAQVEQFAEYQKQHFLRARELRDAIGNLKRQLFQELSAAAPDTAKVERLAAAIGEHQRELEKKTFYHFLGLKRLCTPAQQARLDALFGELLRMLDPRPKLPPREDGHHPSHD